MNKYQKQAEAKRIALEKLSKLQGIDVEADHSEADNILCELLIAFDCEEIVRAYEDIEKWYA